MAPFHEGEVTKSSNINGKTNSNYKLDDNNDNLTKNSITNIDLSTRIHVNRSKEAFGSFGESLIDLPPGAVFAPIVGSTPGGKAYSTVQISPDAHIELNSDLLYCNHSCDPTLEFDVSQMLVRVSRDRPLRKGDMLTFWYPSTEWEMSQPFDCTCGAGKEDKTNSIDPDNKFQEELQPKTNGTTNITSTTNTTTTTKNQKCKGWISGAKDMDEKILRQYWLNEHIEKLLADRNKSLKDDGGAAAVEVDVVGGTNGKAADKADDHHDDGQAGLGATTNGMHGY